MALGLHFGSPRHEMMPFDHLLQAVSRAAGQFRPDNYNDGTQGWINPIFIVPGSIMPPPDFEGFKIGHYSKKERGLVVMIAVPSAVREDGDGHAFIESALRHSVNLAADYFKKKGDPFSFIGANRIIDRVMESVA